MISIDCYLLLLELLPELLLRLLLELLLRLLLELLLLESGIGAEKYNWWV